MFYGEFKELAHGVGDLRGFDEGGHAVFAIVDECYIVAEDVDLDGRVVFARREKGAREEPSFGFLFGVFSELGGSDVFGADIGFDAGFFECFEGVAVGDFIVAAADEIIGGLSSDNFIPD